MWKLFKQKKSDENEMKILNIEREWRWNQANNQPTDLN